MTHFLDPRRNLVSQLSSFFAEEEGPMETGIEVTDERSSDNDHSFFGDLLQEPKESNVTLKESPLQCSKDEDITNHPKRRTEGTYSPIEHRVHLPTEQLRYLQRNEKYQRTLREKLEDLGFSVDFDSVSEIQIQPNGSHPYTVALEMIKDVIGEVDLDISSCVLCSLPDMHIRDIVEDDVEVMVVMDRDKDGFKLVGPTDVVVAIGQRLRKAVQVVLKKELGKEEGTVIASCLADGESFILPETAFKYLKKYKWDEIDKLKEAYRCLYIDGTEKDGNICMVIEGSIDYVQYAAAAMKDILSQVKTTQFRLQSRGGCVEGFHDVATEVEERHRCVIQVPRDGLSSTSMKYSENEKNTKVYFQLGELQKTEADVIVNTTNARLDLKEGWGLSAALHKAGGTGIEKELKLKYQHGIAYGEVAASGSGKLATCKAIYHGALPPYRREDDSSYRMLVLFMKNCLERANSAGHKSIAFPALGLGTLHYPIQNVVQLMYQTVKRFLESTAAVSLGEIGFVIYPASNQLIKQSFIMENLSTHLKSLKIDGVYSLHEEMQTPEKICCEARLPVDRNLIQVFNSDVSSVCDVTKHVLVLWRRKDLDENNGTPFLAFIAPEINQHFNKELVFSTRYLKSVIDRNTVPGYTLIHSIYLDDDVRQTAEAVERGLKVAKKENVHSLTIPIVDDGSRAWHPSNAASVVMDSAKKFSSHINISVAIPDNKTFEAFVIMAMEKNGRNIQESPQTQGIVDAVWASQKSTIPGDIVLFVTSESEDINRHAAEEFARRLRLEIVYTVYDCV